MRPLLIVVCLILVGVAAYQGPPDFFESSSNAPPDDLSCDLNSSDSFVQTAGLSEAAGPHLFKLQLAECESGTLKNVYYDISGPTVAQIYNTDPVHELHYVFIESGDYTVVANYSVELTNGAIVRRKLPLEVVIK